eukprot:TRINITY_DN46631_c0_g1_i1.p1 TRINITY_DN46631_c0_g1~~TRINITY_DN46631_c0_g1_i1.p1  ORF type:complete len:208 (-),score=32.53 TRINITY_DN46631_c0_g1_i1:175-798(-)
MGQGCEGVGVEIDEDDEPNSAPKVEAVPREPVSVIVGCSTHAASSELVQRIARMVNTSYGRSRLSEREVRDRLRGGDESLNPNRVLHLAFRCDELVGCVSSTFQPPWTSKGCGHWGLLVVDKAAQGTGVASALVEAAERRLHEGGCTEVQIEYEYSANDPHLQRLQDWYEGKLGFKRNSGWFINRLLGSLVGQGSTEFRRCWKELGK